MKFGAYMKLLYLNWQYVFVLVLQPVYIVTNKLIELVTPKYIYRMKGYIPWQGQMPNPKAIKLPLAHIIIASLLEYLH